MSDSVEERFYALLPQLYRHRDVLQGQPLRALLAVLEGEYQALSQDVQATYDNWFVDTCDQWVLPYLADLLGIRGLDHAQHLFPTQRRLVANAVAYRRRKGTAAVLEHVLRDVTGWDVRVVEFFQLLSVTQHLAALRPAAGRSVDLRASLALSSAGGAFERFAHTLDVRGSAAESGLAGSDREVQQAKYHPANLGIFIWRLRAYPLDDTFARPVTGSTHAGCFTFDAAGRSVRLFSRPQPVDGVLDRAQAPNLTIPLTRALLASDLRTTTDEAGNSTYYGPDHSFMITYRTGPGNPFQPVRPEELLVADLSNWRVPPGQPSDASGGPQIVAVDPELGRMKFLGPQGPTGMGDVIVSYTYGFNADLGGGAYSRYEALQELENLPEHALRISVAEGGLSELPAATSARSRAALGWPRPLRTLQAALDAWDRYCADCAAADQRPIGAIVILDNGRYGGKSRRGDGQAGDSSGDLVIRLPQGAQLSIIAADGVRPSIRPFSRLRITTTPDQAPPTVSAPRASQKASEPPAPDRRLQLNGLLLEGRPMEIYDEPIQGFVDLELKHCTTLESGIRVRLRSPHAQALRVRIENSNVGAVRLPGDAFELAISDSIVDAGDEECAIAGSAPGEVGPATTLERVTVLGATRVRELKLASDVIFSRPVLVDHCRTGLIRRSYVPSEGSSTPRREHCQPDLALEALGRAVTPPATAASEALTADQERLQRRIRPIFTSTDPGHPGYAQLHPATAIEIRGGGQAGAEMGAFHDLYEHQRVVNLRRALDEYLPLGKQVSIHFVT